jgi:aspartyl-tRNA(Asn)/glutamyl-tRNA(Gln) amidotransferase subunit A
MLSAAGAALSDMRMPELAELPSINAKGGIVAAEAYAGHRAMMAEAGPGYDPRVLNRIALAESILAADFLGYLARRREMIRLFTARCEGIDAVILPTTLNEAPAIAELAQDKDYLRFNAMALRNTYVGNFLNGCAISLPMQATGEAPSGLMLLAPWGRDLSLFGSAGAVERALAPLRNGGQKHA